jgi:hypothetical protein
MVVVVGRMGLASGVGAVAMGDGWLDELGLPLAAEPVGVSKTRLAWIDAFR